MEADIELLKKITFGAVSITPESCGFIFNRYTPYQTELYDRNADNHTCRHKATSGIRFEFVCDADSLTVEGNFSVGSSRNFAYLDVMLNGALIKHEGTENIRDNPDFSMTVELDGKMNRIAIYLPNLACFKLESMLFENASVIEPVTKKNTIVCWGDSITQGYDARYSSLSYTNILADAMDAELFNKGFGGEVFNPELLAEPDHAEPDIITIAYGTNDWFRLDAPTVAVNAEKFFSKICSYYPETPVYVILPLWRKDSDKETPFGNFDNIHKLIRDACKGKSNIHLIDGFSIIPHLESFFEDKRLHPNDLGFCCMAGKLLEQIKLP